MSLRTEVMESLFEEVTFKMYRIIGIRLHAVKRQRNSRYEDPQKYRESVFLKICKKLNEAKFLIGGKAWRSMNLKGLEEIRGSQTAVRSR